MPFVHLQVGDSRCLSLILFLCGSRQSLKIKSAYIEQIRNANLISSGFIPSVLALLDVAESGTRPFDLSGWAVDQFVIEREFGSSADFDSYSTLMDERALVYDPENSVGLSVLAAFLFYRSLVNTPVCFFPRISSSRS